eukprot:scaffold66151_cov72-Cyclotella_meneghiniana.AAC.1
MTTWKRMCEKGTLHAPGSSEWSNLMAMERSKGFNLGLGSDGTMEDSLKDTNDPVSNAVACGGLVAYLAS